jgi:hypothetical protein
MQGPFTFTIEAKRGERWEDVATWERFGVDEADALLGTMRAARREFPIDTLRIRDALGLRVAALTAPEPPTVRTITRAHFEDAKRHGYAGRNEDGSYWMLYLDPRYGTCLGTVRLSA